jgi:anti-sigma B factor antagonist
LSPLKVSGNIMPFYTEKINDIAIETVTISRATFKEAENFKKHLNNEINSGSLKIVIDLTRCVFMDSTFLSTIVTALKRVTKSGGNLKLAGVHSETQALLELTGTVKVFEIYATREEAIRSFDAQPITK